MSKHHRVHKADLASKPRRCEMRAGVQDMHREENDT